MIGLRALYGELIQVETGAFFKDSDLQDKLFSFVYQIGRTDIQRKGCRDCVNRALYALKRYDIKQFDIMESKNSKKIYKFKKGKKYRPPGWGKILSSDNCTQEDAEKCLERQPGAIIYFDVEFVEEEEPKPKKRGRKPKKSIDGTEDNSSEESTPEA